MTRIEEIVRLKNEGVTLREIGSRFGVTGERIRQILLKAERREKTIGDPLFRELYRLDPHGRIATRAVSTLKDCGYDGSIETIAMKSSKEMLLMKGTGVKSLRLIAQALRNLGATSGHPMWNKFLPAEKHTPVNQ